jgi:DNA segregation ATPase FtsK/SpoIIIE-like protein
MLRLSYIHRRLQIGYNRVASPMVRMDRGHFGRMNQAKSARTRAADIEIKLAFAAIFHRNNYLRTPKSR